MYVNLGEKNTFRESWLIFLGIWGEAELILGICGASQNTFGELRNFFQGFGDNNALFQGSTDPLGGSLKWRFAGVLMFGQH